MTNDAPPKVSVKPAAPVPLVGPTQVSLEIPYEPLLAERIRTLRTQVGLSENTVTAYPFGVKFNIPDEATWQFFTAILSKIQPLTLILKQVEAQVEGQQTYRSGWQIDNDGQDQLRRLRTGLISSLKSAAVELVPLGSLLLVADNIAAGAFPALVAAMQRDFEPVTWSINVIQMVVEATAEKPNVNPKKAVDVADSVANKTVDETEGKAGAIAKNGATDALRAGHTADIEDDEIDDIEDDGIEYVDDID